MNWSSMKVSISNVTELTTMIVPVFVSPENSIEPLMVYALLYPQSDSTFILDYVAEELKAQSVDVDLKLSTMTTTSTIKCQKIKNMIIMLIGYNCSLVINPTDVISVRHNELYGVKTLLECSIVGTSSSEPVVTHYNNIKTKVPYNIKLAASHINQVHFVVRTSCMEIINILE